MTEKLSDLTPILNLHYQNLPIDKIYSDTQAFEKAMDDILIMNKVISQSTNQVMGDASQDLAVISLL